MRSGIERLLTVGAVMGTLAFAGCSAKDPVSPDTGGEPGTPIGGGNTNPATAYNITIRYVGGEATARQKLAVERAVARWETVIASDEPDISGDVDANACFAGQPAFTQRIDDIVIFVQFDEIDGAGKILGEAGPCFIRNDDGLPIVGHLELDQADLQAMEARGTLDAVVLHEMGHIIGIGTLWSMSNLISDAGGADPRFTGGQAISAYHSLGGLDQFIPLEDSGEDGTRDGHWRESVFGNELMTGFISGPTNPMSTMTVASLRDMGYNANTSLASQYSFASSTQRVVTSGAVVDFRGAERMKKPKFVMDRNGGKTVFRGQVSTRPWRAK